ncbi:MAG: phospholipase A [Tannerella sp.]|jgi:phospholipase A1|nr:phospholipase A [Tannerella sp.]
MKRTLYLFLFILISHISVAQSIDTNEYPEKENDPSKYEKKIMWAERKDSIRAKIKKRIKERAPSYNADSVRRELERGNYFTLFKDNYFTGGIPLGQKVKASTSNVKFQLSISHRLTKSMLPFDTYLFLQFSQKTIWNVMEESLPIHDLNFNPGIGLGHLIIHENNYIGKAILMLEHESNGKDSLTSRSWNKVSLGINLMLSRNLDAQLKLWVPIVDSDNNRDIVKYNGIGNLGLNYHNDSRRIHAGLLMTWRTESFSFNTQWELSFKLNEKVNQYLFIQYYNGYGENLLDYNQFKSVIRMGFVIKPRDFSIH